MPKAKRRSIGVPDSIIERATHAKSGNPLPRSLDEYAISAINLRRRHWKVLKRVAEARSDIQGGRASVSKVIESLIETNLDKLQGEFSKDEQ
jgi:hypothetical protein